MRKIVNNDKLLANYLAIILRHALEEFHVKYIPQSAMKDLNTILRNKALEFMHTMKNYDDPRVKDFFKYNQSTIPDYWEEPKLPKEYIRAIRRKKPVEM